jgi:hypothetical protein
MAPGSAPLKSTLLISAQAVRVPDRPFGAIETDEALSHDIVAFAIDNHSHLTVQQ